MTESPLTVAAILQAHPDLLPSDIDAEAGVSPGTTQRTKEKLPVSAHDAIQVLAALSGKTRQNYVFGMMEPSLLAKLQAKRPLFEVDVCIGGD